jgi:hypothetical protein
MFTYIPLDDTLLKVALDHGSILLPGKLLERYSIIASNELFQLEVLHVS